MASSSSSASNSQYSPRWKYDVFLSFRGVDTRRTFTGHLYEGLKNRGIITFQDDKRLELGDSIPEELLKAIEESQVALAVFSKNYATSRWCLNELVKIMECKDKNGQLVIPVFYDVDPSEVRNQRKNFAKAFAKNELKYKDDVEGMQKVQEWRTALTAAANLKGYDIRDGIESENILQIVDHISSKLCKSAYSLSSLQDIVGINAHLEKLKSRLQIEINDVRIVGIWGIGGVGKTTIAKAIFDTLSYQFKAACFLADIKENAKKNQLHSLQNTLLSELLRKKDDYVNNKYDGKCMIPSRLCSMKVLIVLDDVDHSDHLEYLADDLGWFGNGSRVVVTTRNRDLIKNDDAIYEVSTLPDHEAMQLFNRHAFRKEIPDECFMMFSLEVVNHAKGLPLALKVWGSLLRNKGLTQWTSTVGQIKKNSSLEIVEKLKISYDGLEPEEQKIFLDIACLLRGEGKNQIIQILESCDFGAEHGLDVLIDKSLVFISKNDTIEMHDLIQDMGRYVVKMQKDSAEQSRLWDTNDFKEVMVNNTGTATAMEAIWIYGVQKLCFSEKAMKNMKSLRLLSIFSFHAFDDSMEYLPNSLRWFVCHKFPWESLPGNFEPQRLVYLDLHLSLVRQLWTGTKPHLPSLRKLNLSFSENLMQTPDFTGMPNLEYLNLWNCSNLDEVHHSLGCSRKLIWLKLYNCKRLKRFPCVNVESLGSLDLRYCSSLEKFPETLGRMKPELKIHMRPSGIRELSSSMFQHQAFLTELDLSDMKNLVALPSSNGMLKDLVKLNVSHCSKLESLPEDIGDLENLEELHARCTLISQPPSSIVLLNKLKFLTFEKQTSEYGVFFVFPKVNGGLHSLEHLNLSSCNLKDGGLPKDIGCLSYLKELYLSGNNFEHLPRSISQLGALRSLDLSNCKRLKELPGFMGMQNLEHLLLWNCYDLEEVHDSLGCCRKLIELNLINCYSLERYPFVNVESLYLGGCSSLEKFPADILRRMKYQASLTNLNFNFMKKLVTLPSGIGMLKGLVELNVSYCSKLERLPEEIGDLENLETLNVRSALISRPPSSIFRLNKLKFLDFGKLKSEDGVYFVFPQINEGLCSLEYLNLNYCNLVDGGLPEDIGSLSSLKELHLTGNNFEHLPRSVAQLSALQSLDLSNCKRLRELPSFIGMQNLDNLKLSYCNLIEGGLPEDIGCLHSLKVLNLSYCNLIDGGLLDDIGCLSSLRELYLGGNNFEHLPRSIAQLGALRSLDLSNCKRLRELPGFMGMQNLHTLNISYCNLIDGGLPEDIECLSSLEKLNLSGNNFEHLPRSIAHLGSLRSLALSDCNSLTQLPEFPEKLDTIYADWSNDSICNLLFQNISSLQHEISASDSLSLRVFTTLDGGKNIPSWFDHRGTDRRVTFKLSENWHVGDNFLGFAICYSGKLIDITAHLIPLCDDAMSCITKLALYNRFREFGFHFFFVPLAGVWDTSKANGTPNDYGHIMLHFSGEMKNYGLRLLYKDGTKLDASCSSSKKHSNICRRVASLFRNFLHFPANTGI